MKIRIVVALAAVFLAVPAVTHAIEFSAGISFGKLDPSGNIQSGALGDKISLTSVLDIGEDSPVGVNLRIDGEKHHFSFDYTAIAFDGDNTFTKTITFQGKKYGIVVPTETDLKFNLSELTYYYDLYEMNPSPGTEFFFAPLIKLSIYDTEVSLKTVGIDESFSETLPIPTIGFVVGGKFSQYVRAAVQFSTISYSGNSFTNYEITVGVRPIQYLNLDIGYKGTNMDFDESDDALDFEMKGLYGQMSAVYTF